MVENCGKIIDKNRQKNLDIPAESELIQLSETTKKVTHFLIAIFQHRYSPISAPSSVAYLSTLPIIHRLWTTHAIALVFSHRCHPSTVDNLFAPYRLMWGTTYANLGAIFYAPFPQAIIIHISFFFKE